MENLQKKDATIAISIKTDSGYRNHWSARCSPLQYAAICRIIEKEVVSEWIAFDDSKPETRPENLRKVWLISDCIKIEDECIAYYDGNFYRNTEDWLIDDALLINVKWQYVELPKP